MKEMLGPILAIQELDMKMLRLIRVRLLRSQELEQIHSLRRDLHEQMSEKGKEISDLGKTIQTFEQQIQEINQKIKKFEAQQSSIKKVEEFNALTLEMTAAERERIAIEHKVSDIVDKRVLEEEVLTKLKDALKISEESSHNLEKEITSSIQMINEEGRSLKKERDALAKKADESVLKIYEKLFRNKKDRIIVPIENRTCGGCHIVLTAQHENVVRKGEKLTFCEHCSRIHFWREPEAAEATTGAPAKRRRRRVAV